MTYEDTITAILNGKKIIDINNIFHIKVWRFHFALYSPLQIVVRKTKTFFPTLNFYSIHHWWQNPFYFRYTDPKTEKIIKEIESSN